MSGSGIAVLGGTGALGSGLAHRWSKAGLDVIIGSRETGKAQEAAGRFSGRPGHVTGTDTVSAAAQAGIIVIAVPWSSHAATLAEIAPHVAGKLVIDVVVPLVPPKVSVVQLPEGGSAAQQAQAALPGARVVGAFHNVAASKLQGDGEIDCDVLVCGDDKEAREKVIELVAAAGMRGIDAGALANSAAGEALTSVLIAINRRYKVGHAGIRITGLP